MTNGEIETLIIIGVLLVAATCLVVGFILDERARKRRRTRAWERARTRVRAGKTVANISPLPYNGSRDPDWPDVA